MKKHATIIEYDKIAQKLADHAVSEKGKEEAMALTPYMNEAECRARMAETTGARTIIDGMGTPPVSPMTDISRILQLVALGSMLAPEQLSGIAAFITTCRRMQGYLKKAEYIETMVSFYGREIILMDELYAEIERCIRVDAVDDHASSELKNIRRRMESAKENIKQKLDSMLRGHKDWFSEGFIVTRGDRFALPVRKEYKHLVVGTVLDTSSSGQTVFIEPSQARKLSDELADLQVAEDNEVRRILYTLTGEVESYLPELQKNVSIMETLDFVFAKGKLSAALAAIEPALTTQRHITIVQGKHPLLDAATCVPLDFSIGDGITGVIITGPNTGGKTVALKTVGLLSMMAQSGLHVPVGPGSTFTMHSNVLCDIGDGQSITENLSTFSAHMTNIIGILGEATHESLVLLDELGSGTDPAEGMGLAVAILEELRSIGCLLVSTSHYPEIKEYAAKTPGLINARMAFDRESLAPLYRLQMGEAGESCALYIAQRLGFPPHMIACAQRAAYAATEGKPAAGTIELPIQAAPEERKKTPSQIKRKAEVATEPKRQDRFQIGDSVRVFPQKDTGIVFKPADDQGNLVVQVKGKKISVNHRRVQIIVPASQLYPDDYDFSIVFDNVANRKARHKLDKGNPNAVIQYDSEMEGM